MRKRAILARGLVLAAALVTISSVSLAAPAKGKKPHAGKKAPKTAPPASDDDAAPAKADDSAAAKADADAPKADAPQPPPADAAPTAEPVEAAAVQLDETPSPKLEDKAASKPDDESSADRDAAALGRREAARLAAGRIEVAVSLSGDVASRHFKYSDPVGPLLAPYRLPIAPMATLGLEAYPFASSNVPVLRDFGFRGHLSRAVAVDSTTPDGVTIKTSWTRFGGEVRERLIVPGPHRFELGIDLGADASYFGMSTKTTVQALLPEARTVALRFGFDTRLLIAGQFSLLLGAAYLATTSRGEIYDRFRAPHVGGLDGDFGAVLGIIPGLEARLSARYTRYFASFKPRLGDQLVAGGALDEQMQFGLGVRYAH